MDPTPYQQIAEQTPDRLALIAANNGPDDIYVSMSVADLTGTVPIGIKVPANTQFSLTWMLHGELVWGPWYASCTGSNIAVYEWRNSCRYDPSRLSPVRSPVDVCVRATTPGRHRQRRDPLLYALVADMLDRCRSERRNCRERPSPQIPANVVVDLEIVA